MSRTDKTAPWWVREARNEIHKNGALIASWRERGSGPSGVKFAKREASKARRRGVTNPYKIKSLTQTYIYNSG